jgi:hypothetical protein
MRKQITDDFGTYETKTKNRIPVEEAKSIYLNIFDNKERDNACRYKLVLSLVMDDDYQDYICPVLNHFEPARWLRSVPDGIKDEPFYRDFHRAINTWKKQDVEFDKFPSAGFFRPKRTKSLQQTQQIMSIPNAIGLMCQMKDEDPFVAIRFVDFAWSGAVKPNEKAKGPDYSVCIKASATDLADIDYSEYF